MVDLYIFRKNTGFNLILILTSLMCKSMTISLIVIISLGVARLDRQLEAAEAACAPRADRQRQPRGRETAGGQVADQGCGHRRPGQQEGDPGDAADSRCAFPLTAL